MKLHYLPTLALLVPLGAAQSPELLEYRSLCSEQTDGTKTFENGVTSEYICHVKASGTAIGEKPAESAEECAAMCGKGCPGVIWQYTKKACAFYAAPVTLSAHSRGSVYLKPTEVHQEEDGPSNSECSYEKKACEDELAHQQVISEKCQSEQLALESTNQQCEQQKDELDTKSKTCELEKDDLDTKCKSCQREKDELDTKGKTCQREKDELDTKGKTCQREKDELDTKGKTCQREKDELDTKGKTCQREKDELDTKNKTCQREKDELDTNWKEKYKQEVNGVPLKQGIYYSAIPYAYWAGPTVLGRFPTHDTKLWQLCADACEKDTTCKASYATYSQGTCYKVFPPTGGLTTKHLQDSQGGNYAVYVK